MSALDGLFLIDKPCGPTSFDMVRTVRRAVGERKVGHAGTLDPLASGLLVICVGNGTKLVPYLMEGEKRYLARIALGKETETDDALGAVTAESVVPDLGRDAVEAALRGFVGTISQVPPVYSALKEGGEPLYKKARRKDAVSPKARDVTVYGIELVGMSAGELELDIRCKKGTYVRSLARDLGRALGTYGHIAALRRTSSSGFDISRALSPEELVKAAKEKRIEDLIVQLSDALLSFPRITLTDEELSCVRQGRELKSAGRCESFEVDDGAHLALLDGRGRLAAVAVLSGVAIKPVRVIMS